MSYVITEKAMYVCCVLVCVCVFGGGLELARRGDQQQPDFIQRLVCGHPGIKIFQVRHQFRRARLVVEDVG